MTQPSTGWSTYPAFAAFLAWTDASGANNSLVFDVVVTETWEEDATVTEHPVEQGADVADHVRVQLRTCELKVWASNEPINANNWDDATVTSTTVDLDPNSVEPRWQVGDGQITIPTWDNPIILRSLAGSLVGLAGGLVGNAVGGAKAGAITGDIAALVGLEAAFLLDPAEAVPQTIQTDAGLNPTVSGTVKVQVQQFPDASSGGTDYVARTIQLLKMLKDTAQQIDVTGTKQFCSPMVIEKLTTVRSADTGTGADITIGLKEIRLVTTKTVPVPIPNLAAGGGAPPSNKGKKDAANAPPATAQSVIKALITGAGSNPIASLLALFGG